MISRQLPCFLAIIILLPFFFIGLSCDRSGSKSGLDFTELENRLDSLISLARQLPDNEQQDILVSLYYQSKLVMDIVPDSSVVKAKAILFTMNKLGKAGGFDEAIRQGWKAIEISYKANLDDPGSYRAQTFGTLAGLYSSIGKKDSTLIIYKMAVSDATHNSNRISLATSLNNAGIFYDLHGQPDSALIYFQAADSLMNITDAKDNYRLFFRGNIRGNIASVFFDRGEFAKAKALYLENYHLYERIDDGLSLLNASISLAKTEIELGNYIQADNLLELSQKRLDSAYLDHEKKISNQLYLLEVRQNYFEKIRDMAGALAITKKILSLSDSTSRTAQSNQLFTSGLLARYSSSMFQSVLQNETMLRKAEEQRARLRFWIFVLIAMGLTITPTILLFYYRQNARLQKERNKLIESDQLFTQQKLELEQKEKLLLDLELENKKKDLTEIALHLSKKQEWASELNQRIKLIESLKGSKRLREFNALKNEIRSQLYIDKERSVIVDNIESLNAAFYEKLNQKYPSLTPAEMKLFSLIKLKMSNAQIAQLQNINPDSVRMSRLRLRRKLNLEPNQDLDNFIQNF